MHENHFIQVFARSTVFCPCLISLGHLGRTSITFILSQEDGCCCPHPKSTSWFIPGLVETFYQALWISKNYLLIKGNLSQGFCLFFFFLIVEVFSMAFKFTVVNFQGSLNQLFNNNFGRCQQHNLYHWQSIFVYYRARPEQ